MPAIVYAFLNDFPVFYCKDNKPMLTEFFPVGYDLSWLGYVPEHFRLNRYADDRPRFFHGIRKKEIYDKMLICLSSAGRVPLGHYIKSIRFLGERKLQMTLKDERQLRILFKRAYVFNNDEIDGLKTKTINRVDRKRYLVTDWFLGRSLGRGAADVIKGGDDFIKYIFLYPSPRGELNEYAPATKVKKDLVCVSYLYEDELSSDIFELQIKTIRMLKENGYLGELNGFWKGKVRYRPIKIEHDETLTRCLTPDHFEDTDSLIFQYASEFFFIKLFVGLLDEYKHKSYRYYKKLYRRSPYWNTLAKINSKHFVRKSRAKTSELEL